MKIEALGGVVILFLEYRERICSCYAHSEISAPQCGHAPPISNISLFLPWLLSTITHSASHAKQAGLGALRVAHAKLNWAQMTDARTEGTHRLLRCTQQELNRGR